MPQPRYGQKELEANNRRQIEERLRREQAEREAEEKLQNRKNAVRDEIRFWLPILISVISLIVSILK